MRPTGIAVLVLSALLAAATAIPAHAISRAAPAVEDELDYRQAKAAIAREDYAPAIEALTRLNAERPGEADILNLLGFAYRKSGDKASAARFYTRALTVDAAHRGALEYQGELFLETGDLASARANLERLTALCGTCEERQDLAEAIEAAPKQ